MNGSQIKIAPYSGWSRGAAARWLFLSVTLLLSWQYLHAAVTSWPKPLDVILLVSLGLFYVGFCAYFICRFIKIDEQQITRGGFGCWASFSEVR
jgi:hypothetical protein